MDFVGVILIGVEIFFGICGWGWIFLWLYRIWCGYFFGYSEWMIDIFEVIGIGVWRFFWLYRLGGFFRGLFELECDGFVSSYSYGNFIFLWLY